MKLSILIIGSRTDVFGGIANYIKSMMHSRLSKEFKLKHHPFSKIKASNSLVISFLSLIHTLNSINLNLFRKKVDILHIHTAGYLSFWRTCLIILVAKIHRKKTILQFHSAQFKEFYKGCNFVQRLLIRYFIGTTNKVIVLSVGWKEFYNKLSLLPPKEIISTFVDPPKMKLEEMVKNRDRNGEIKLLFFSVLSERKGLKDILAILNNLLEIPNLSVTISGAIAENEKAIYKELLLASKTYGDRFIVESDVDKSRKDDLYKTADIYFLPTYAEGLPTTMLEAMSYGLPIISTPVGAIPEVIKDNVNGYLINPGDHNSLFFSIQKLVNNNKLRNKMGYNNYEIISENYVTDKVMKKFSHIYKSFFSNLN